jgi:nucleoside-diphosphate-sugar epimerase
MSTPFVLITGASGFIGAEVLYQALAKGYRTRATVRKEEQVAAIKARHPDAGDRLDVIVTADLGDTAALTKALSGGIDYVLHIASPMPSGGLDLHTGYINPAVRGTLAVLDAAKAVPSVKRVVITSSALSLGPLDFADHPGFLVKEGTNRSVVVDASVPVPDGPSAEGTKYHISKILAHRATLDWVDAANKKGDKIPEIVTVHPLYVIGHDRTQPAKGGQAHGVNYFYLASLQMPTPFVPSALVDVRDVATIHVAAVTTPSQVLEGNGHEVTEVIAKGPRITWEEIVSFAKEKYPSFTVNQTSPGPHTEPMAADTTRAQRDFGVPQFHPALDSVAALLEQNTE